MALPQQVVEQLGREPADTQGWAFGAVLFSGGILFLTIIIYLGMSYGYEPYLQGKITDAQNQIATLNNSISPTDQSNLIHFYSQISNLKTLLQKHTLTSQFFTWLGNNTEANIYYQSFSLAAGYKVTATGHAATEADVNQQIAIFENSPEVNSVSVSNVGQAPTNGGWNFTMLLTMSPSLFSASNK